MMTKENAETFVHNINEAFSSTDHVKAWSEVHGQSEAEVVVQVDYEEQQRLHLQSDHQALAVFQLIYAAKKEGLHDGLT